MPQATFVHDGASVDYTPGVDVVSGTVVVQADLVGVARTDLPANQRGSLAVEGVFDFAKSTAGGSALAAGATVYWDNVAKVATATVGSNKQIGKVVKAALDADATVRVRMNQ
jgi:predicted RecA/RadA family phage recombinase